MSAYHFVANKAMRKQVVKPLRAHSPAHRVWMLLSVACVLWGVVCYRLFQQRMASTVPAAAEPPEMAGMVGALVSAGITFLFAGIPLIVMQIQRFRQVEGLVTMRRAESLTLEAAGIQQQYLYQTARADRRGTRSKCCFTFMYYGDIRRIEYYRKENALKVYGKTYFCSVAGEPKSDTIVRVLDGPSNAYRVFFLYYENAEQIVSLLAEKTGLPIITPDRCTTSLQEVQNKGVG